MPGNAFVEIRHYPITIGGFRADWIVALQSTIHEHLRGELFPAIFRHGELGFMPRFFLKCLLQEEQNIATQHAPLGIQFALLRGRWGWMPGNGS